MTTFSGHSLTCIRGTRLIFQGLDFSIEQGNVLYLTGPNGSGKSSLLRLMTGLLSPASGDIKWQDQCIHANRSDFCTDMVYLGHQNAIKPNLSVKDNLILWSKTQNTEALEQWGLEKLIHYPARYLSAGQQRRLSLARIQASNKKLWLLDEPTVSLDQKSQDLFQNVLQNHIGQGGYAVVATHNITPGKNAQTLELAA